MTNLKFLDNVKLYKARASGATKGPLPTKSRGAGEVNPRLYLISFAFSHPGWKL